MAASAKIAQKQRSKMGQFFTPSVVAEHLGRLIQLPPVGTDFTLLDPGAGPGSLSAAVVAHAIEQGWSGRLRVTAVEMDPAVAETLTETLDDCMQTAGAAGIEMTFEVVVDDFLEWVARLDQLDTGTDLPAQYDAAIMNPPYLKIATSSRQRALVEAAGCGSPNLYSAFITMTMRVLDHNGQLVAITPRSFANGTYFQPFRRDLLSRGSLTDVHVYESRDAAFADTDVLQESVIWRLGLGAAATDTVNVSHSASPEEPWHVRSLAQSEVITPGDDQLVIHLRLDARADAVAAKMAAMPCSYGQLSAQVSTGMVVDFRSRDWLVESATDNTVPMVYQANARDGECRWPDGAGKPSHFVACDETQKMLLPEGWYVVVKRFSAKEEPRRVVAAVWNPNTYPGPVAFDNKTNVFHAGKRGLSEAFARGLTAYLNSRLVDEAFRNFSGHTQVNAGDLKMLRYPTPEQLEAIGNALMGRPLWGDEMDDVLDEQLADERMTA